MLQGDGSEKRKAQGDGFCGVASFAKGGKKTTKAAFARDEGQDKKSGYKKTASYESEGPDMGGGIFLRDKTKTPNQSG